MIERWRYTLAGAMVALVACAGWALWCGTAAAQDVPQEVEDLSDRLDVPYIASHQSVLATMFDLAKVTKDDFVIDLGSGDGRIVIAAAKRFGARGFGVDLNEELVAIANAAAREEGVADRARFYVRDLFKTDFSQATVLTMYLLPQVVLKLRPKLLSDLAPGSRIVSHDYDLGDWRPDESRKVEGDWRSRSVVHFWVVPADVAGTWVWELGPAARPGGGHLAEARIAQRFQVATGRVAMGGFSREMRNVSLRGRRLSFTLPAGTNGTPREDYSGTVEGAVITGTVRHAEGGRVMERPWRARRRAQAGGLAR